MSTAFITGATAGFGKEIAIIFAEHGYNVIINGRRKDLLEELEANIIDNYGGIGKFNILFGNYKSEIKDLTK